MIWFQHFHKCAGTYFIELCQSQGYETVPDSANGNPKVDGKYVPIWNYDDSTLRNWLEQNDCDEKRLVCTEWGVPNSTPIFERPNGRFVTIIRDPWKRFISNYLYDLKCCFTDARSLKTYYKYKRNFMNPNYFTHMLSKKDNRDFNVTEEDYKKAIEKLSEFTAVFIQEDPNLNAKLHGFLGIEYVPSKEGRNHTKSMSLKTLYWTIRHRSISSLLVYFKESFKTKEFEKFRDEIYIPDNTLDYKLYEEAKKIAR